MTGKILSFGEILLRICPDREGDWLRNNRIRQHVGGAEANVATALALWGLPSSYMTAVPGNFMSDQILSYLERKSVKTDLVIQGEGRLGLFFLAEGQDMKHSEVIYDREYSAFSKLQPRSIDWDTALEGVSWLHMSAISPALTADAAAVCLEAVKAASQRDIFVSFDLNYRAKLWRYGKLPIEIIPEIANYCDLIMGNIWAAETMLGTKLDRSSIQEGNQESLVRQAEIVSKEIMSRYPKCSIVANTFRFNFGDSGIEYYTTLFSGNSNYVSTTYKTDRIVDKVGSGDCFMAGLIYGFYKGLAPQEVLEFATAAAYSKLFVEGDATNQKIDDIVQLFQKHENPSSHY